MTKRNQPIAAFAICLALTICGNAFAGVITTSVLSNSETDVVVTGGVVVSAVSFGVGVPVSVDINGIVHTTASANNNGDGADLISELTVNSDFDGNYRATQAGTAGYTSDMLTLMTGIAGATPSPLTLAISGLTPGTDYLFQGYWEAKDFNQTASITFEGTDTETGITQPGAPGVLISYAFTAGVGDSVLNVDFTVTGDSANGWLQGYSLQEANAVPTPAALPAGLALLGLAAMRRRRT